MSSYFVATGCSCCRSASELVHPALGNSKCVDDTLAMHCETSCPMCSCFVATSCRCLSNEIIINQCQVNESGIEIHDSSTRKTGAIRNAQRCLYAEILSIFWLWSSSVFRLVIYTTWAVLEQCKLFSACGVSFQLLFRQVEFRGQLLQMVFCRNRYLKHDYIAVSDQARSYQKLSFCYFILSCRLALGIVIFLTLFYSPRVSSCRNPLHKKRKLSCSLTSGRSSHTNIRRGGHGTMKFSTAEFLRDFVEPHGQQVQTGETYDYVDHTDDVGLLSYSKDMYVFSNIPLRDLLTQVTVSQARVIMKRHNISCGARESMSAMQSRLEHHSGLCCMLNKSVFIKRLTNPKPPTERWRTHIEKKSKTFTKTADPSCDESSNIEFPPAPLDENLSNVIIEQACNRMEAQNINEAGCAVCGELKPLHNMSRLKAVKQQLHILAASGVTRLERKESSIPLREYKGPILDYKCTMICNSCRGSIRNGKIPKLALANGLWIGDIPPQLKCLNFVEKMLVARIRHTCAYVKVASGMRKMTANVVAFQSPVPKVYTMLPPPRDDLDEVLAILYTGPCKPTPEDLKRLPFFVRRNKVVSALEWLILNHRDYADIRISQQNLEQYSETEIPVSIEYRECSSNKIPEGTSKYDLEAEHGVMEGECSFSVHGLTGESIETMSSEALKAAALKHLDIGGSMLAVGHNSEPESIYNNPHLYPQMFPWLFPYGLGGIGSTSLSDKEHKRHLLMYHDKRFQTDINFPFVASAMSK
jgi:hypothetical protein